MVSGAPRCFLLLTLGLVTLPAYALGDQINVFIYGALAAVGLAVVAAVGWLIRALVTAPTTARRNELLFGVLLLGLLGLLWVVG
jgi:hypothetical protein